MANDQTVYGASTYGQGPYSPYRTTPTGVTDTETLGTPGTSLTLMSAAPTGVSDTEKIGAAGGTSTSVAYGAGNYGAATYSGATAGNIINPAGVTDTEKVGGVTGANPSLAGYGSDSYGAGPYVGEYTNQVTPNTIFDTDRVSNLGEHLPDAGYGAGQYGNGIYPGQKPAVVLPPIPPVNLPAGNPLHLLAVGPWNPVKVWRGATNYGIGKGRRPAVPTMQLPAVQSKTFVLRLDGGEATTELQMARTDAIIIEEMATDLWWRRKDPITGKLEMIGRFNSSHNDLTRDDAGNVTSSIQFTDYRTVLGDRRLLKYLNTTYAKDGTVESQNNNWPANIPVTSIMRFVTPKDTGLDISALDDDTLLGNTTLPFTCSPADTVADIYTALQVVSPKKWEWWVEQPTDQALPPTLHITIGQRGQDKGVYLFDYGTGPTPIASWSMRAAADSYANTLYFQGGGEPGGGVIVNDTAQVAEYGERDAVFSNGAIKGTLDVFKKAAIAKLADLSDRRPTFSIVLKAGWWRGRAHIDIGDTIRLRIKLGSELMAYNYRVTELSVAVDDTGTETVSVTLGNPLPSKNPRSRNSANYRLLRALLNYVAPTGSEVLDATQ